MRARGREGRLAGGGERSVGRGRGEKREEGKGGEEKRGVFTYVMTIPAPRSAVPMIGKIQCDFASAVHFEKRLALANQCLHVEGLTRSFLAARHSSIIASLSSEMTRLKVGIFSLTPYINNPTGTTNPPTIIVGNLYSGLGSPPFLFTNTATTLSDNNPPTAIPTNEPTPIPK